MGRSKGPGGPQSGRAPAAVATERKDVGEGRVARRRARVRERILAAADRLIARHGVDGVTIDDIADAAEIARRSFYLHFDSKDAMLLPLARERTRALTDRVDRHVASIADPAAVMATALRHVLRGLGADPLCRWLILRSGLGVERLYEGLDGRGLRDAKRAIEAGRFHVANENVARLLVAGGVVAVLGAHSEGALRDEDLDDAVEHLLRLFGLEADEARRLSHGPLAALPRARRSPARRTEKGRPGR
jgi:AcrR family transcriptional regulator